jgi:predicted ATPase/DNA-binding SARP family transcriptional activator
VAPAAAGVLHVDLLGRFRIRMQDEESERSIDQISHRQVALLLAYLLLNAQRANSRQRIVELFWPDVEPLAARNSLRVVLSRLNRLLDQTSTRAARSEPLLRTGDRRYIAINPARWAATDVAQFEAALLRAEAAGSANAGSGSDTRRRRESYERAVGLYSGPLMPGYNEAWVSAERERLEERYRTALQRLVRIAAEDRAYDKALDLARRVLSLDPDREGAHRDLIRLHLLTGNQKAALRQFRELEERVRNTTPAGSLSPATLALRAEIAVDNESDRSSAPVGSAEPSLRADAAGAGVAGASAVPVSPTPFFGREAEISQIRLLLEGGGRHSPLLSRRRLVTVIGAGGIGKTRLVQEAARDLSTAGRFAGSVWWLSVNDVSSADSLLTELVERIQVRRQTATGSTVPAAEAASPLHAAAAALTAHISAGAGSQSAGGLLVLDNVEMFLDATSRIVRDLLSLTPSLSCLVTSRMPLGLSGEQSYPVPPLPCRPDYAGEDRDVHIGVEAFVDLPAVQLFTDRARAVRPMFTITAQNAATVSSLCEHLEGNPLAIELAAAWMRSLSLDQVMERIVGVGSFGVLTTSDPRVPERHRSMTSVIDDSERLLSPESRRLFRKLSVFRGGFTVDAAAAICGADFSLDRLVALCDQSLVSLRPDGRFGLLESLREHGNSNLSPGERLSLQRRHARHYLAALGGEVVDADYESNRVGLMRLMECELDNIRVSMDRCTAATDPDDVMAGLKLAAVRWDFWKDRRALLPEGRDRLRRMLARAEEVGDATVYPSKFWFRATVGAAQMASVLGDFDDAQSRFERAAQKASECDLLPGELAAHMANGWGVMELNRGNLDAAQVLLERSIKLLWEASSGVRTVAYASQRNHLGLAYHNLGVVFYRRGQHGDADRFSEKAAGIAAEMVAEDPADYGALRSLASALSSQGLAKIRLGQYGPARRLLEEAAGIFRQIEDNIGELRTRCYEGRWILAAQRNPEAAASVFRTALTGACDSGDYIVLLMALQGLFSASHMAGDNPERAGILLGNITALYEHYGCSLTDSESAEILADRASLEAAFGAHIIAAAWERGRAMSAPEILAYAKMPL